MTQPNYQAGGERAWWWKIAMHLDEARVATSNVLAHNTDDPTPVYVLQGKLREMQVFLLEIFRWKGLLPGLVEVPGESGGEVSVAAGAPASAPNVSAAVGAPAVAGAAAVAGHAAVQEGVSISHAGIVSEGCILNDVATPTTGGETSAQEGASASHVVITSQISEDGWILNDVAVRVTGEIDALVITGEDAVSPAVSPDV